MYLTQPLYKARRERPDGQAVVFGSRRASFAQLCERVAKLAGVLRELGMATGDSVAIMAHNSDRDIDGDGYLFVVDRNKDMVVTGGDIRDSEKRTD